MNWVIEREALESNREEAQRAIGRLLQEDKSSFQKKCKICGKPLPWNYAYAVCDDCFMAEEYEE